jgi:hypothetical protein
MVHLSKIPAWPEEAKKYAQNPPDPHKPGLISMLVAQNKRSNGENNRAIIERYNGKFGLILPTKEKPLLVHPQNVFGTRGGINALKASVREHDWTSEMCTSRAQVIDMGTYWWALGGGKRGVAVQEIQHEEPSARCLRSFDGFEAVIYEEALSEDGETIEYIVGEANSKNMLCSGMILIDKLVRGGEPEPAFRRRIPRK